MFERFEGRVRSAQWQKAVEILCGKDVSKRQLKACWGLGILGLRGTVMR